MTQPNLYEFLGISREANSEEINKAYREKAKILHPDKNKDPQAANQFKFLMQAYQVLIDPERRKKYDATLPPAPAVQPLIKDPAQLWQRAGEIFFKQSDRYTPAVDAMRNTRAIIIENDELLVLGMDARNAGQIGYLTATMTQNLVRRIISDLYGKKIDFRIINGTTIEEWEAIRDAEARIQQKKNVVSKKVLAPRAPAETEDAEDTVSAGTGDITWDDVLETLSRQWSAVESRSFPQSRARFVFDALPILARAEDMSRAAGMSDDLLQRSLARAIERTANLSSIDSGIIAIEYLRYRARLLGGI